MHTYCALVRGAAYEWQNKEPGKSGRTLRTTLALVSLLALVLWAAGKWRLAAFIVVLPLTIAAAGWWGLFVRTSVRQNTPSHARLVPHLRGRMMRTAAALWLVLTVALALPATALGAPFATACTWTGFVLLFLALVQRHIWMPYVLCGASGVVNLLLPRIAPGIDPDAWLRLPDALPLSQGLLAAGAVYTLTALYPRGGDAHRRWHGRMADRVARLRGGAARLTPGQRFALPWSYDAALQRSAEKTTAAAAGRRALLVFGPLAHYGQIVAPAAVTVTVALALAAFDAVAPGSTLATISPTFALAFCLLPLIAQPLSAAAAVQATLGEQALWRLTPAAPSGPQIGRVLSLALLHRFTAMWATSALAGIGAALLLGAPRSDLPYLAALAMLPLPYGALLVRDYGARRAMEDAPRSLAIAVALIALTGTFAVVRDLVYAVPWLLLGLAPLLAFVVMAGRRLRALPAAM